MAKFNELPGIAQLGIVVGVLVLITGGLYWYVYQDLDNHNRQLRATLKAKQDENNALRPYADKKADMERQIASLKDQLEQMKRIVPDEKEAPQFMEMMEAEARKAGVQIRRYDAGTTSPNEFFTAVGWVVDIDGPYYSVLRFFEDVSGMPRIVNVSDMHMSSVAEPGQSGVRKTYKYAPTESVVVNCSMTTFFSHEPQAVAAAKR